MVLALSGRLEFSFCIAWQRAKTGRRVVTVAVDSFGLDDTARQQQVAVQPGSLFVDGTAADARCARAVRLGPSPGARAR